MEGRRRTIELDEAVVDALERRAAERGVSLDAFLSAVGGQDEPAVHLSPEDLAELDARLAQWEADGLGYDAEEVFAWLRGRASGEQAPFPRLRRY